MGQSWHHLFQREEASLNENKTIKAGRYAVWLMISTLAYIICLIIGFVAEKQGCTMIFKQILIDTEEYFPFFIWDAKFLEKK